MDTDFDPRKQTFATTYLNPISNTYGNALQSAIKAGFKRSYAVHILATKPRWLCEIVRNMNILDKVKENIEKDLSMRVTSPVLTPTGPYIDEKTGKMLWLLDPKLLKIRQAMTFFVLEKLDPHTWGEIREGKKEEPHRIPILVTESENYETLLLN